MGPPRIEDGVLRDGGLLLKTKLTIRRYMDGKMFALGIPYDVSEVIGNVGLNQGIAALIDTALMGTTTSSFHSGVAHCGVGTATTAEGATQTGLQSGHWYGTQDAGYPTRSGQAIAWRSTAGGAAANAAWQEFTVGMASGPAAIDLFRKVSNQGTKTSGQTWELTEEVTIS